VRGLGCEMLKEVCLIAILFLKIEEALMKELIEEDDERLKSISTREHYNEAEAKTNQEYLLKPRANEGQEGEERKVHLLLKQDQLPKTGDQPFQWEQIQIPQGINREMILKGDFIQQKENLIFYGGVGTGKSYLAALISLHAIHKFG